MKNSRISPGSNTPGDDTYTADIQVNIEFKDMVSEANLIYFI